MPLSGGTSGAHDDSMHQGNAKRDTVDGLAALDASGFVLAKGAGIAFPRSGSDDVHIYERTSGEEAYAFHRAGADDYTFYIKESNVWKRFQTESMKDVANGIAALDANGYLLVPGYRVYIPRNAGEEVLLFERTSGEIISRLKRDGADDYSMKIVSGGSPSLVQLANMKDAANGIAGLDAAGKVPDANLEIPVTGHGAAQHTDITRKIFLPIHATELSSGSEGVDYYHPCYVGAANADDPTIFAEVMVPTDFVSFTSMKMLWTSPAAVGNLYWDLRASYGQAGESRSVHVDARTTGITATGGANILNLQAPSDPLTLPNLAVGDFVGINMRRWGTQAADTIDDVVNAIGFVFEYIANQ